MIYKCGDGEENGIGWYGSVWCVYVSTGGELLVF